MYWDNKTLYCSISHWDPPLMGLFRLHLSPYPLKICIYMLGLIRLSPFCSISGSTFSLFLIHFSSVIMMWWTTRGYLLLWWWDEETPSNLWTVPVCPPVWFSTVPICLKSVIIQQHSSPVKPCRMNASSQLISKDFYDVSRVVLIKSDIENHVLVKFC